MGDTNLTIVPIKDMRHAGQLLDYARIEKRHQSKARFSGLLISLRLLSDDWLAFLQQLNQAFKQQYGIKHSMKALPGMHDWADQLRKNKQRHIIMLRIPRLTSTEVLAKLVEWAETERRNSSLQMIIAVHEKLFRNPKIQQAVLRAGQNVNVYTHDGQHHRFEAQFQPKTWRPTATMLAGLMLAVVSGLWLIV